MRVCVCREPAVLTAKPRQKIPGKAPGSSLTVVYPERARRKPKAQKLKQKHEHQKSDNRDKNREETYTVTSSGEVINVNSHSAIFGLVTIPLGRHVGLAGRSWLGGCLGEGAEREEKERKNFGGWA